MNSSNYAVYSMLLSEQQAAQMFNIVCQHQIYLASMLYKI